MKLRYLVCLLLTALCITAATVMQNVFGRMPLCLLISTALVSLVYAFLVYRSFSFLESSTEKICTREKVFDYRFTLANDTALFIPHIRVDFFDGCKIIRKDLAAKPHQSRTVEMEFQFRHIGVYDIGFLSAKVYGLVGILSLPYHNYCHQMVVIPRIGDMERTFSLEKDEQPKQSLPSCLKSGSTDNLDGVRPYVPGDSQKRIHWKLTAHTGNYMSRMDENPESYAVDIFLDLSRPETDGEEEALCVLDRLVESALAASNCSLRQGGTVRLLFHREGRMVEESVTDFGMLSRTAVKFAQCGYCAAVSAEELLGGDRGRRRSRNLIVCTPNLNYDLACYLAELKNSRQNPVLLYVETAGKASGGQKMIEYLENKGIDVRKIPA